MEKNYKVEYEKAAAERDALTREKYRREMVIVALTDKCVSLSSDLQTAEWKCSKLADELAAIKVGKPANEG